MKDFEVIIKGTVKKAELMSEFKEKYTKKAKANEVNYGKRKMAETKLERMVLNKLIIIKSFKNLAEKEELEENMWQVYGNLLEHYGASKKVS